jgi:hypothetical protein
MYRSPITQSFRAILASALLAACTGSVADHADDPACSAPELRKAYDSAYAWGEDGAGAMGPDDVNEATGSSPTQACTVAGYREGLRTRHGQHGHHHDDHHGRCQHGGHHGGGGADPDQQCKDDGTAFGEAAAQVFCDLSISLGGLGVDELLPPGPSSSCSNKYEEACHAAFDRVAANFEMVSGDPDAHCAPFTTGDFLEAYQVARFNQCLFSVGDPQMPPSDDGGTPEEPCTGSECSCHEQGECDLTCTGPGCELTCERAGACSESCDDGCKATCRDLASCEVHAQADADLTCQRSEQCRMDATSGSVTCSEAKSCDIHVAQQGTVTCTDSASCNVECPDCAVTCTNVGTCSVKLDKGSLRCDQVDECELTCATPGYHVKKSGDGSYVCEKDCR